MSEPLHIYVDIVKQKGILEKKDNGVYELLKRTGSFTVSIKEYEDEVRKLPQKNGKIPESEILALQQKFSDVVWIYQLSGNNLPHYATANSFNETKLVGKTFEWNPDIDELEVGGGFVYIQPYRRGEKPEINLNNGSIFFSFGIPEIKGAMWYEDKNGDKPIAKDSVIAFGSTVYLLVYTKDLYGQMLGIQFKDDDSIMSGDDDDATDDDLGIYPESGSRMSYKINDSLPVTIKKDIKIERQVKTFELGNIPEKATTGNIYITDSNKSDGKMTRKESIQGAFFPVFIDPFWSFEANGFLEGSKIEIFPTITNGNIKNESVLKSSILKVSEDGKKLNTNLEQFNRTVLVGEAEANSADFYHCRYNTIKLSEKGKAPITVFDSTNPLLRKNNPILIDVIAGKKSVYYVDIDFDTNECEAKPSKHIDKEITLTAIPKGYVSDIVSGGKVDNIVVKEEKESKSSLSYNTTLSGSSSTNKEEVTNKKEPGKVTIRKNQIEFDAFYYYDIPYNTEADALTIFGKALQYFWLPDLGNKIKHIKLKASSCAYDKNLDISIYPDIKWTLKFGFNVTADHIEALNKKGKKSPFGIFEALTDAKDKAQKEADEKDKKYLDENNHLKKIRNQQINETRKEFGLKKKPKKKKTESLPVAEGKIAGLIKILKELKISLSEEHYGGDQSNELSEEYVKQFYNRYQAQFDILLQVAEIIDGDKDGAGSGIDSLLDSKGKSVAGLREKMKRKPVEYSINYPQIALAGSWFYEKIDETQYPELAGRQGLGLNINFSAKPLVGVTITWDLLELLCRRHPIAYAVLKALDALIYIIGDDESAITCVASITGNIEAEVDFQHNMLAGFKDIAVKGKTAISVKLEFSINIAQTYKMLNYDVLVKRGFSMGASSGIGITDLCGIDSEGFYLQKILEFEGIKFEFSATGIIELNKHKGNKKDSLLNLGGEIKGEITFLDYKYESPKIHFN